MKAAEKISLREAFGRALVEIAKKREDFVIFDADVAGGTCTNHFRKAFPQRFFQFGIAEQNMMSAAAGFSTLGVIPIVTAYAVFASMRAIEQARNSVAYPRMNVKVVASHPGIDVGPDGPSHQAMEDIAIYRSIPGFSIVAPGDPKEAKSALEAILDYEGPVYMRTGRSAHMSVLDDDYKFEFGKGKIVRGGKDLTVIATGVMLHRAVLASDELKKEGISCRVVNMSTIKPIDEEMIIRCAKETNFIVTAEDHNIFGGLGSAVAEVLSTKCPTKLEMIGHNDIFAESGDPEKLAEQYGISAKAITKRIKEVFKNVSRKN